MRASTARAAESTRPETTKAVQLVDSDIHPYASSFAELREFLPQPWRDQHWVDQVARTMHASIYVAPGEDRGMRADAMSPDGGPAGSDPTFVAEELFGRLGIDY